MPRASGLASLSIEELNAELSRRRRKLPALQSKRARLMRRVEAIDAQINVLGGAVPTSKKHAPAKRGPGRPVGSGGRRRAKNDGGLVQFLKKALTGNTMGVTEVSAAVKKMGYKTTSPNFRTIVNAALVNKKNGFKRVARGKYTAG